MPIAVDYLADANKVELVRFAKLYDFPAFVKSASFEKTFSTTPVSRQHCADPINAQFPCNTRARTWLSYLYFTEKRAEFKEKEATRIQHRLDHYVDYWGIKGDVDNLLGKHAEYTKDAQTRLPDSTYAFVWVDTESGHKERRLPLRNPNEVKVAADWLFKYHERLPFQDANIIATRVLEKAAAFGASITNHIDFLEKKAGRGVCDPRRVVAAIKRRAGMAKQAEVRTHIGELAKIIESTPHRALGPDMLVKLACTLDMIDRAQGFTSKYGSDLDRPEDVIFEATFTKSAKEISGLVATTSGKAYKKAHLAKVGLDALRDLFGDEFANEVKSGKDKVDLEKLAEVVHTLPRGDAEQFDRLMRDQGVDPTLVKSASVRQGFTKADFEKLAMAYATSP